MAFAAFALNSIDTAIIYPMTLVQWGKSKNTPIKFEGTNQVLKVMYLKFLLDECHKNKESGFITLGYVIWFK